MINKEQHTRSIAWKIIIACLFAVSAIWLSLYVSKVTLNKILVTVGELSQPNKRITLVNEIFRDVVKLDQLQRNEDLKNMRASAGIFIEQYKQLELKLDSLQVLVSPNEVQVKRIDTMKHLLNDKKVLYARYINMRVKILTNDTISTQIRNLSGLIEKAGARLDSNKVTTTRKTEVTVDTLINNEEKQSLWRRIFPKKKKHRDVVHKKVKEELNTRVDTINAGVEGKSVAEISKALSEAEANRTANRSIMINRRAAVNHVSNILLGQLLQTLNDIEADEVLHTRQKNNSASGVINGGLENIKVILAFFILGIVVLLYMIYTDILRSISYRNQLILAKEDAEEAGRVKQRFLANMSHELRTPLQAIVGIAEQMQLKKEASTRNIENVYHASQHLLHTVNEILDYSRIVSGKYVLDNQPFNIYKIITEVKDIVQVQAETKGLYFNTGLKIDQDAYYVGDAFRLKQILLNVLGNAVKYTEKGGIDFEVSVIMNEDADLFTFAIKDTGAGIEEDDIKVIFNEFEQLEGNTQQGTGLGLNIVKTLVDLHGGNIIVAGEKGRSSIFTIVLPFERTAAPLRESSAPLPYAKYGGYVWVVDDDTFILELCDDILTKYGIPHACFASYKEVLAAEVPGKLNIVFLDIRMPDINGIELCKMLRARLSTIPPKFIALTAQVLPNEQAQILAEGFDIILFKPFVEDKFINAIYGSGSAIRVNYGAEGSELYKFTKGNPELLNKYINRFIAQSGADITLIRELTDKGNLEMLTTVIHRVAGRCGQLGEKKLAQQFRLLERDINNKLISDDIVHHIQAACAELTKCITMLKDS